MPTIVLAFGRMDVDSADRGRGEPGGPSTRVGEGRRFMEYQESAVEKVAQTEIRKAIAGPQTQQLDDDEHPRATGGREEQQSAGRAPRPRI